MQKEKLTNSLYESSHQYFDEPITLAFYVLWKRVLKVQSSET